MDRKMNNASISYNVTLECFTGNCEAFFSSKCMKEGIVSSNNFRVRDIFAKRS